MVNSLSPEATSPKEEAKIAVVAACAELGSSGARIQEQLEGGASTRQFFRIDLEGRSTIAMYTPSPSQEIAKARQSSGYASFVEVAALLSEHQLPVPKVIAAAKNVPVLFVEDLGDDTLANYLLKFPEAKQQLYQKAVKLLAHAQLHLTPLPASSVILTRAFDYELLLWEVDHFRTWALHARDIKLKAEDEQVFERCAAYLANTISQWPRGFVHRDYQSRNIMVQGTRGEETLTWIDFQDAMLGPRVYDLVALLTDSYQSFSRSFISERLDEYCQSKGCVAERDAISREFSLVTVQRKLKDAGRFVFLDRVNGNPNFLKFVDPTIVKARKALHCVKDQGPLGELDALLTRLFGPLDVSGD